MSTKRCLREVDEWEARMVVAGEANRVVVTLIDWRSKAFSLGQGQELQRHRGMNDGIG